MKRYSTEMKKKIVTANIQDGRTISSLASEYGVSIALINNWIRHEFWLTKLIVYIMKKIIISCIFLPNFVPTGFVVVRWRED